MGPLVFGNNDGVHAETHGSEAREGAESGSGGEAEEHGGGWSRRGDGARRLQRTSQRGDARWEASQWLAHPIPLGQGGRRSGRCRCPGARGVAGENGAEVCDRAASAGPAPHAVQEAVRERPGPHADGSHERWFGRGGGLEGVGRRVEVAVGGGVRRRHRRGVACRGENEPREGR